MGVRVKVEHSQLQFVDDVTGTGMGIVFQRTLRIPDDGKVYPLPPGLGAFPIKRVLDYEKRVPASWVKTSGVFIPMYQREALWVSLNARHWRPNAVKIAAGKINAVSGKPWNQELRRPEPNPYRGREPDSDAEIQDYLTCPPQPWLDGFNTGSGTIRQFIAMPLGMGYTVEGQVTGIEEHGGLQIIVYEPKPGRFPDAPPQNMRSGSGSYGMPMAPMAAPPPPQSAGAAMGLAAGGSMKQKIYPDPHGIETWDESTFGRVFVHIVNSSMYREITGEEPPPTPVTAKTYAEYKYPWFELYDDHLGDVKASPVLADVKSVAQVDASHGFVGVQDDASVDVGTVKKLGLGKKDVPDGDW